MIGLLDCNNFFVSCERLFRPDLVGKPVAVLSSNDGCIVARSQEVKNMGVPMGMPLFQLKQLFDTQAVTFFSSNFPLYRDISRRVMDMLEREVGACEVYSVDESFFKLPDAVTLEDLQALRARVIQKTGIPVSIGVAATKTRAKVASKLGKQQSGVSVLREEEWRAVARSYPVAQVWNIGRATAKTLRKHSISTIEDFVNVDARTVDHLLGIAGRRAQDELLGVLVYTLAANSSDIRQSLASTRSFAKVCADKTLLESAVAYHLTHVAEKLRQKKLAAGALLVELRPSRHGDFAFRGGSFLVPLEVPTNNSAELLKAALRAVSHLYEPRVPYKKAGVTALQLVPESFVQPALFGEGKSLRVQSSVDTVVDQLNRRFGPSTIHAATIVDRGPKTSSSMRSPHYTTAWSDIPTVRAT